MQAPTIPFALPDGSALDRRLRVYLADAAKSPLAARPTPSSGASVPPLVAGHLLGAGRYRVEDLIGQGAMGAVYRGCDTHVDRPVALKVMRCGTAWMRQWFDREVSAMVQVDHRNVIRVLDHGRGEDDLAFIVMELFAGETLAALLTLGGPMSTRRIADLVCQVCTGLAAAHGKGILHRDVKPSNIMVSPGHSGAEIVKLCDFGLAEIGASWRVLPPDRRTPREPELAVGTPEYISPEQACGHELDVRTDVYACGVVLYEMATGTVPFSGSDPMSILLAHVATTPAKPSAIRHDVDARLEAVIMKALAKDRAARHENVLALRSELRRVVDGG